MDWRAFILKAGKIAAGLALLLEATAPALITGCAAPDVIYLESDRSPYFNSFVCNYTQDTDGDGTLDHIEGLNKTRFKRSEEIWVCAFVQHKPGVRLRLEVYDPKGEKIAGSYFDLSPGTRLPHHKFKPNELTELGQYTAKWIINGLEVDRDYFDVTQ